MARLRNRATVIVLPLLMWGCGQTVQKKSADESVRFDTSRIVSLHGTVTETLVGLGLQSSIVGVDVTSTYPPELAELPRVGHNRNVSVEGVLSLSPTLIIGTEGNLDAATEEQLRGSGVSFLLLPHGQDVDGAKSLVRSLGDTLGLPDKALPIILGIDASMDKLATLDPAPKVLFIYARGAGTLMVAGEGTQLHSIIGLAGGVNAAIGFSDFKPLTAEAVIAADPDVLLMFDSGLASLDEGGIKSIPGLAVTSAGRNESVITMDGQYLSGFGPRTGQAILELNQRFREIIQP